ncbi:MAG TPA: Flp family type IVb pilin [Nocardioidaceae bacterium]|nr:Flp family type IVb pilin [Nocardioidaceae bacterium]
MCRTRITERGATSVEYALLLSLIAAAIILAVGLLGVSATGLFEKPCEELATSGRPC